MGGTTGVGSECAEMFKVLTRRMLASRAAI
jgi:hypothetical protein